MTYTAPTGPDEYDQARQAAADAQAVSGSAATPVPNGADRPRPAMVSGRHNLSRGQVRLGAVVPDGRCDPRVRRGFAIDHDVLRTSLLVTGPPGSGKTWSVGRPIVEHLCLSSLEGRASVVVIDPKGDDYADDGWFDVTINLLDPTVGYDLYGGAPTAHIAADQLTSLLLPAGVSPDHQFFRNAASNRCADALHAYQLAHDRFPRIRDLLAVLRAQPHVTTELRERLKGKPGADEARKKLLNRKAEVGAKFDPAASIIEALAMLDQPAPRKLFEFPGRRFSMAEINHPIRVRVIISEAEYPDASRFLTGIVIAHFLQVTSARNANRNILKVLVFDEAGDKATPKLARAIQVVRSNNAGVVLMSQTLQDFPEDIRHVIFGSTGCKIVFGGGEPDDAAHYSRWFGERTVTDTTVGRGAGTGKTYDAWRTPGGSRSSINDSIAFNRRNEPRWSEAAVINDLNAGECLAAVTTSAGLRVGPLRVNTRG